MNSGTLARWGLFAPLGVFLVVLLIGFFGFRLEDPHRLPSALLGQPFPEFRAPLLDPSRAPQSLGAARYVEQGDSAMAASMVRTDAALATSKNPNAAARPVTGAGPRSLYVTREDLLGDILLVNVWATWCPTCKAEHEELARIRRQENVRIVGINYKDNPEAARRWLRELGDPYEFNILDTDGSLGVELGVYGAPETFLLDAEGIIVYKRIGEITRQVWVEELAPRIARLRAAKLEAG